MTGLQVQKLGNNGRSAQIHCNAETFAWSESERRPVFQNWHFPLGEFQLQVSVHLMATRHPPAVGDLGRRQQTCLIVSHRQRAANDFDSTAITAAAAAAWELDALRE